MVKKLDAIKMYEIAESGNAGSTLVLLPYLTQLGYVKQGVFSECPRLYRALLVAVPSGATRNVNLGQLNLG